MPGYLRLFWIVVCLFPLAAFSIGNGDDAEETRIPLPQKNFTAEITDTGESKFLARRVSLEGKTYIIGLVGKAKATIPFDNIAEITLGKTGDPLKVEAVVKLREGGNIKAILEATSVAYGETNFGKFEISLADIGKVRFLEQ